MFRVAILSFWHVHAQDYAGEAEAHPQTQLVALWDEDQERGRSEASRYGLPFHADLGELLADPSVDGVVVTTPTVTHHKIIPQAAVAGKHVFAEKVIAPTLSEAQQIVSQVEEAGISFMVSLPRLYTGYTQAVKEAVERHLLGQVTYLRIRVSHDGAVPTERHSRGWLPERFFDARESAGGVMIDFGAHPLYLIYHLLGMPEEVQANYGRITGRTVEDNAVVTMRYPNGTLAVAEASFVGGYSPFVIEAHGTEGSLVYGGPQERLILTGPNIASNDGWTAKTVLPADPPSPFARWVEHARQGTADRQNLQIALALNSLADAANRSAAQGCPVRPQRPS